MRMNPKRSCDIRTKEEQMSPIMKEKLLR